MLSKVVIWKLDIKMNLYNWRNEMPHLFWNLLSIYQISDYFHHAQCKYPILGTMSMIAGSEDNMAERTFQFLLLLFFQFLYKSPLILIEWPAIPENHSLYNVFVRADVHFVLTRPLFLLHSFQRRPTTSPRLSKLQ